MTDGDEFIRDDMGVDALGLEEATEEAKAALEELHSSDAVDMPGPGWHLIIRDEDGATLKTLPLHDDTSH